MFTTGDGKIRRTSLANWSKGETFSACSAVCEVSLNGYITSINQVENERTKEDFLVGGADDGSLAFWSSTYVSSIA